MKVKGRLLLLAWTCLSMLTTAAQNRDTTSSASVALIQSPLGDTLSLPAQDTVEVALKEGTLTAETLQSQQATQLADSLLVSLPNLQKKAYMPNPIRSMWLAMVFPGGGQIYNRKYWKLPIVYGGFLGCVYAFSWNSQMLRDYSQAYLDIMDSDPNTKSYEKMLPLNYDITGREERFKEIFKNKKNYFRKYRDMSIFAFAGVYLISIIDAYVDAELSTFDISRDLSLNWQPAVLNHDNRLMRRYTPQAWGVQCNLAF